MNYFLQIDIENISIFKLVNYFANVHQEVKTVV
jgi:hypothetical protein